MKTRRHHPLQDAAIQCGISIDILIRFISFEWILPEDPQHQLLDDEDITRARLIWQLQHEFGVNDDSVPIILHLIDQLNRTQLEVRGRISNL
jgi:chaperone modulatory protein CbpM